MNIWTLMVCNCWNKIIWLLVFPQLKTKLVFVKIHHFSFPKTAWRANAPLESVYADICGPTRTPSLNNKRYFLFFVDDYYKMIWIFFLAKKLNAFTIFLQFKVFAEKQSVCQMKTLRTNRAEKQTFFSWLLQGKWHLEATYS